MTDTTSLIDESTVLSIADVIGDKISESADAFWYRRKLDKSGYEVIFSKPEEYEYAGAGIIVGRRKHADAAWKLTQNLRNQFIARAVLKELK